MCAPLAVRKRRQERGLGVIGGRRSGAVLALVGPPGVGKPNPGIAGQRRARLILLRRVVAFEAFESLAVVSVSGLVLASAAEVRPRQDVSPAVAGGKDERGEQAADLVAGQGDQAILALYCPIVTTPGKRATTTRTGDPPLQY